MWMEEFGMAMREFNRFERRCMLLYPKAKDETLPTQKEELIYRRGGYTVKGTSLYKSKRKMRL